MKFAWVTLDGDAKVVIVEAADHEAAKLGVARHMAEYMAEGDDDGEGDDDRIEEALDSYDEEWRIYGLSEEGLVV